MILSIKKQKPRLIVALDVNTLAEVREIVEKLANVVDIFKVGSQLFTSCGPAAVRFIEAQGKRVFLDLKYHDIPNTVASAVEAATGLTVALERSTREFNRRQPNKNLGVFMLTVHTQGGEEMMAASVKAGTKTAEKLGVSKPLIVGITVLTSEAKTDNIQALVLQRAHLAKKSGLDGVVASVEEAALIRKEFGAGFVIVTPGIRPAGSDVGDQKRIATPAEAVRQGSDFLVVGRPVLQAKDPVEAVKQILAEIDSVKQ